MEFNALDELRRRLSLAPLTEEEAYSYFLKCYEREEEKPWRLEGLKKEVKQLEEAREAGVLAHPAVGVFASFHREYKQHIASVSPLLEHCTLIQKRETSWLIPHCCLMGMSIQVFTAGGEDSLEVERYLHRLNEGLVESYFAFSSAPQGVREACLKTFGSLFPEAALTPGFFHSDYFSHVQFVTDALEMFKDKLVMLILLEHVASNPGVFREKPALFHVLLNLIREGPLVGYSSEPLPPGEDPFLALVLSFAVLYRSLETLGLEGALTLSEEALQHPGEVPLEALLWYLDHRDTYQDMPLSWWLPLVMAELKKERI